MSNATTLHIVTHISKNDLTQIDKSPCAFHICIMVTNNGLSIAREKKVAISVKFETNNKCSIKVIFILCLYWKPNEYLDMRSTINYK